MDLCLLIVRRGGSLLVDALRARTGAPRLLDRLWPSALQLHDLRAMHLAGAGESDHIGLALAPPRQRGRPFAGSVECIYLLTGRNHAAVHQACHKRRQLPRCDRDHGLIQERESGFDLRLLQSYPALLVAGTGDEVGVATALADCGGVGCSSVRDLVVTRGETLLDDRQQQIAPLGTFARITLQQTLGTGKPAGRAAHLAAHEQAKTEPECATDGAKAPASISVRIVGSFERLEIILVLADQVSGHRQQVEVLGSQRHFLVGAQERLVSVGPSALLIVFTGEIEFAVFADVYPLLPARTLHAFCSCHQETSRPMRLPKHHRPISWLW